MADSYYQPGAQRAEKVEDLFARIATRYDLINDLQSLGLHRRWKHALVRLASLAPGQPALDVCCGTGDIALALAAAGADVTGLDFSEPMLAVARQRAERRARAFASPPRFLAGDALQLPFPDAAFAAVTVGYGLRNLASWERGLEEMWRVTRHGGRVLVLDFGKPPHPLWRRLYFAYLRWIVPLYGRCFCGDARAYSYILESLAHYPAQQGVDARLLALGGVDVRTFSFLGAVMTINVARKP